MSLNAEHTESNPASTFLSVDADYFNYVHPKHYVRFLDWLLHRFPTARWSAVSNHQQMLRHVNQSKCCELINFDTHSDLHSMNTGEFSCGSWVSYVKWRDAGEYHWIRSQSSLYGDCSHDSPIFSKRSYRYAVSDWARLQSTFISARSSLDVFEKLLGEKQITHISLCLSPLYANDDLMDVMEAWCATHKLRISPEDPTFGDHGIRFRDVPVRQSVFRKFARSAWNRNSAGWLQFYPMTAQEKKHAEYYECENFIFRQPNRASSIAR